MESRRPHGHLRARDSHPLEIGWPTVAARIESAPDPAELQARLSASPPDDRSPPPGPAYRTEPR